MTDDALGADHALTNAPPPGYVAFDTTDARPLSVLARAGVCGSAAYAAILAARAGLCTYRRSTTSNLDDEGFRIATNLLHGLWVSILCVSVAWVLLDVLWTNRQIKRLGLSGDGKRAKFQKLLKREPDIWRRYRSYVRSSFLYFGGVLLLRRVPQPSSSTSLQRLQNADTRAAIIFVCSAFFAAVLCRTEWRAKRAVETLPTDYALRPGAPALF